MTILGAFVVAWLAVAVLIYLWVAAWALWRQLLRIPRPLRNFSRGRRTLAAR